MSRTETNDGGKQADSHCCCDEARTKAPYSGPQLRVFGSLSSLTMGNVGTKADGGSGMGMP